MEAIEYIKEKIQYCIENGKNKIVIAPMGRWGILTKNILNEQYGMQEELCLDNKNYDNQVVYPINKKYLSNPDYTYLVAVHDESIKHEIVEQLLPYVEEKQIIDVFSDTIFYEKMWNTYGKVELDFLCVGFQKCGTTSLQIALSQNPNIFVPSEKETFFVNNIRKESAHKKIQGSYPQEKLRDKCIGGVEPTYLRYAKEVYEYFGPDLKILMCVRNPIEATYSLFKMEMRTSGGNTIEYLKKFGKITPDVFEVWLEEKALPFMYINYIREYLEYYPKQNIKIIILEELCSNPKKVMREVQEFIGLSENNIVEYETIPHINIGSHVPRNLACAYVNRCITQMLFKDIEPEIKVELHLLRNEVFKITNMDYHEEMHKKSAEKLFNLYSASIYELENFLGKDLKGIWYD